jgi:DNA-binding transcriptional ArsR family regulator
MTDIFTALADPTRRSLLEALAKKPEQSVSDLVALTKLGQPTVSKHLKTLRDADLVTVKVSGQNRFYSVKTAGLTKVAMWVRSVGANDAVDKDIDVIGEKLGEMFAVGSAWIAEQLAGKVNIETDPKVLGRELGRKLHDAKSGAEKQTKKVVKKVIRK